MGFLKRLFSIGGKKNKKARPQISSPTALQHLSFPMPVRQAEEEHEHVAARLLRSSSTRFVVVSENDTASLPPLSHPINEVINSGTITSAASIAPSTVSQRGTYSVTVHRKMQHATTEFPNANRGLNTAVQTIESGRDLGEAGIRLLRLRSDPSVASLIDLYDDHGRIPSEAFSNTPPEGRAQNPRNGSTLRELLGNPSSINSRGKAMDSSALEGDISWAERFLGETDSVSSASSFGLRTPNDPDTHFTTPAIRQDLDQEFTFFTDHDLSNMTIDNPRVSSMEVELSSIADISYQGEPSSFSKSQYEDNLRTPQRASQVFDFLTKKNTPSADDEDDIERSLPQLPSCFSSPSDENSLRGVRSHFSDDTASDIIPPSMTSTTRRSVIPSIGDTSTTSFQVIDSQAIEPRTPLQPSFQVSVQALHTPIRAEVPPCDAVHKVKVLMDGPTKVIVTAPTPSEHARDTPRISRIPRGPRAPSSRRRSGSYHHVSRPTLSERSNSMSSESRSASSKTREQFSVSPRHRRSSSQISIVDASLPEICTEPSRIGKADANPQTRTPVRSGVDKTGTGKENVTKSAALMARAPIPFTPIRSHSRSQSSLSRIAVHPGIFKPPFGMEASPASSSELSPIGRQVMNDARQQRMKARAADRHRDLGRRTSLYAGDSKSTARRI